MSDNTPNYKPEFICIDTLVEDIKKAKESGQDVKVALSISGGGAAGAFEAGIIEALKAKGIEVSFVLGASAGALNAAGIIYEYLDTTNPEIKSSAPKTYIAKIWSFLDNYAHPKKNNAARFVLNKPDLITSLCKNIIGGKKGSISFDGIYSVLSQLLDIQKPLILSLIGAVTLVLGLIMLFLGNLMFFQGSDSVRWLSLLYTGNIGLSAGWLLVAAGIGMIAVAALAFLLKEGVFENENLYSTLYKASNDKAEMNPAKLASENELKKQAEVIAQKWYAKYDDYLKSGTKTPPLQLILTGTDLTLQNAVFFTLVTNETYNKLVKGGWYTAQVVPKSIKFPVVMPEELLKAWNPVASDTPLVIRAENFFDALISSTSIPAVFPTRHIPLYHLDDYAQATSKSQTHIFTDGGVLNNSPINVAIDAGATHVISLELGNICMLPFNEFSSQEGAKFSMGETFFRSFSTSMTVSLEKDISASASWNKFLVKNPAVREKRIVQIYRISPELRPAVPSVGLVDFNGRYKDGKLATTLTQWMGYGHDIASGKKSFWRATTDAYPVLGNDGVTGQYEDCPKEK